LNPNGLARVPQPAATAVKPAAESRHPWQLAALAAALLLAVVGAAVLYLWPDDSQPETIPAAVVPATPAPPTAIPTDVTLADVPVPASALPAGAAGSSIAHLSLAPGSSAVGMETPNAQLVYVMAGSVTIRPNSAVQVSHDGGDWADVAPGSVATVGIGDVMFLVEPQQPRFENAGEAPVELLVCNLNSGDGFDAPDLSGFVGNEYQTSGPGAISLTGSAGRLLLRRVVLAANDSVTPGPDTFDQLVLGLMQDPSGTPQSPLLFRNPDRSVENFGGSVTVYIATLELVGPPATAPSGSSAGPTSDSPATATTGTAAALPRIGSVFR
jgi:hypothetical protein